MSLMLSGITVIDFTNNIAGPVCSAMLADHGAEVIHIEKPVWGDDSRNYFPTYMGTSCTFSYANRNKESLALDIRDPRGVEVVKEISAARTSSWRATDPAYWRDTALPMSRSGSSIPG